MNVSLIQENSRLNEQEFARREIVLQSYPRSLFIQLDAPCNQDCLFCSRPGAYTYFDLGTFKRRFEEKLMAAMQRAERLNLTGSGELLLLPEARKILDYFNSYPGAEKMFATNGSSLTPKMVDHIVGSGNRYVIHVSLHASRSDVHRVMTKSDTYDVVLNNTNYIRALKEKNAAPNLTVKYVFLATTRNIGDLPDFIRFAYDNRADGVIVYYNYVYRKDQKELSCYFKQEETNAMLDMTAACSLMLEKKYGRSIMLALPNKFKQTIYPDQGLCGEPWSQLMINAGGDVISCDVAGDSRESLNDRTFEEVWNGSYFRSIRTMLVEGGKGCSRFCPRANPACINTFAGHLITRGKSERELREFLEGTKENVNL